MASSDDPCTASENETTVLAQLPLPLGVSLPPGDAHALSVSMPKWEHVIGYEEGRPEVLNAMACGYPRFFRHPYVRELVQHLKDTFEPFKQLPGAPSDWNLMVMPTEATAQRLRYFLTTPEEDQVMDPVDVDTVRVHAVRGGIVWAVTFPDKLTVLSNRFWQHTGEIVSSRHAQHALRELRDASPRDNHTALLPMNGTRTHDTLRTRIAGLYREDGISVQDRDVFLYPTGMGSIFAALRLLTHFERDAEAILFGFPYLDSLKMQQRTQWCPGVHFFPIGCEKGMQQVEELLKKQKVLAIFTEFPGNPLLSLPDLERLGQLAHAHGTFLVVDDTIGSYNINPMRYGSADMVVTSLAKIFSGSCNAMGGSLVLNPTSASYSQFHDHLAAHNDAFLLEDDARVLCRASDDLLERVARINTTASVIVERLQAHPLVKALYYPERRADVERYDRLLVHSSPSTSKRYGPLFSVVFHGGERVARTFYDALLLAKGPSLGTNFTLVCPYTLLAHYYELDYVESCGVDRFLVRFSIGLEDVDAIWSAVDRALTAAQAVGAEISS